MRKAPAKLVADDEISRRRGKNGEDGPRPRGTDRQPPGRDHQTRDTGRTREPDPQPLYDVARFPPSGGNSTPAGPDWALFCHLVQTGQLYEHLMARMPAGATLARDQLKKRFLADVIAYDADAVEKQWKDRDATRDLLVATAGQLQALTDWTPIAMETALRELADERGVAAGKIFQPLRVALTGLAVSPGIFDVLSVLGKDESLARLRDQVPKAA